MVTLVCALRLETAFSSFLFSVTVPCFEVPSTQPSSLAIFSLVGKLYLFRQHPIQTSSSWKGQAEAIEHVKLREDIFVKRSTKDHFRDT